MNTNLERNWALIPSLQSMVLFSGTGWVFVTMNVINFFTEVKAVILSWSLDLLVLVKGYLFDSPAADLWQQHDVKML